MYHLGEQKGFTLVEILLTVAVLVLLVTISGPALTAYLEKRSLDTWALSLQDALRRAQAQAKAGIQDSVYGVHLEADQFILFAGSTYTPDPEDEVSVLPGTVTLSNITLTGGGSDVIFDQNTGETDEDGSVTITYTNGGTKTVSVNPLGLVEVVP